MCEVMVTSLRLSWWRRVTTLDDAWLRLSWWRRVTTVVTVTARDNSWSLSKRRWCYMTAPFHDEMMTWRNWNYDVINVKLPWEIWETVNCRLLVLKALNWRVFISADSVFCFSLRKNSKYILLLFQFKKNVYLTFEKYVNIGATKTATITTICSGILLGR